MQSVIIFHICFCIFFLDNTRLQNAHGANLDVIKYRRQTKNTDCPNTQFTCDSGQCINDIELCDGNGDCDDNSDENMKVCNSETCPDTAFQCNYGACIHINGYCNGLRDCFDGSDEESCKDRVFDREGCQLPYNPSHGKYVVNNHLSVGYNPGDTVPIFSVLSLNCNQGYAINPPEDEDPSYCLPTGQWTSASNTCVRMSLFSEGCRLPTNPSHGKYVVINYLSAEYNPGDIIPVYGLLLVTCNSGYVAHPLEDDKPSYCLPTEDWTPAPKTCVLANLRSSNTGCVFPSNLKHGKYVVTNNLESEYNPGDIVPVDGLLTVNCNAGYEVKQSADDNPSNCLSTGEWSPPPKVCVIKPILSLGCKIPTNPPNGKYAVINNISSEYNPGDIVPVYSLLYVNCNTGYQIYPPAEDNPSNCLPTEEWIPAPKTCAVMPFRSEGCIFPNNPIHGKYTVIDHLSSEYNPGDVVPVHSLLSMNCNAGYEINPLADDKPSKCLSTGKWTPIPKTCAITPFVSEGCIIHSNPPNGNYVLMNHQSVGYNSGDIVPVLGLLFVSCDQGYEVNTLVGDSPTYCLPTGEWIHAPKTCVIPTLRSFNAGCIFPTNPSHGKYYVLTNNLTSEYDPGVIVPVNSILSANCDKGYQVFAPPENDKRSLCLDTGMWFPGPRTCAPMHSPTKGCQFPNYHSHSHYFTTYIHGKYTVIDHLSVEYNPGDIVSVYSFLFLVCEEGYVVVNPTEYDEYISYCSPSGEWIPALKTCSVKILPNINTGCIFPSNPPNGEYFVANYFLSEYIPGDTVPVPGLLSVNCTRGYRANPATDDKSSSCSERGEWTPTPKTCSLFLNQGCKMPSNPIHGKYVVNNHLSHEYNPGDIVPADGLLSVNCNKGYEVNQSADNKPSNCLSTGEWSPSAKSCIIAPIVRKGCIFPSNPTNGKYTVISYLSSEYNPGDIVPIQSLLYVNCSTGYQVNPPEDDNPSNCLTTREWDPPPKECTQLYGKGCPFPNNPSNGNYEVINLYAYVPSEYNPGDIVQVNGLLYTNCNKGYGVDLSTEDKPSLCLPTGEWNPAPPSLCVTINFSESYSGGCKFPLDPANGKNFVINDISDYNHGDIVPVHGKLFTKCNRGYETSPPQYYYPSNCLSTGFWTHSAGACKLIRYPGDGCIFPSHPSDGQYIVTNHLSSDYDTGDLVPVKSLLSLNCNKGYEVVSPADDTPSICRPTGEWDPSPNMCTRSDFHSEGCPFPNNPSHGEYIAISGSSIKYHPGDIVPVESFLAVRCDTGYEANLTGNNNFLTFRCLPVGEWSPAPRTCRPKYSPDEGCKIPNNPPNGKYVVINHLPHDNNPGAIVPEDSLLSVDCNQGYEVNSSEDDKPSSCSSTGDWSPSPKVCAIAPIMNEGCIFPSNPTYGKYILIDEFELFEYSAGEAVPQNAILSVSCNPGYAVNPPEIGNLSYCGSTGEWSPAVKTCERSCPSLISTNTTNVVCEFDGKPLNTCSSAVENTVARLSCAPLYEEVSMERFPTRLCNDGSWNYPIPQCYPICGKMRTSSVNIVNGRLVTPGDHPWHVGIYSIQGVVICVGSIINQRTVLSVASCFTSNKGKLNAKEKFTIAAGKYYSRYDDERDIQAQYSDINVIHIPKGFRGESKHFDGNIAVIILSTPFQLSVNVQPVCIDFEAEKKHEFTVDGIVAGWSFYRNQNKIMSEALREDTVSYLPLNKCFEEAYLGFDKFIGEDKICGKYNNNGTWICMGSLGNALVFPKGSSNRYFIEGIRSIHPRLSISTCESYGTYTSVTAYINFIRENIKED